MTDTVEAILQRQSHARLQEPAPEGADLEAILACGLRAPDHALLRPSRFLVVSGPGRQRLGEVFASALMEDRPDASPEEVEKARTRPLRAPMIIIGVTSPKEHPKVPPVEQTLSTGVALGYMLLALEARGFGGIWRTGSYAYHRRVREGLGLERNERITGFLYVGTPASSGVGKSRPETAQFVRTWPEASS